MEPSYDDGFKWFGEGFDGFPKHLPDNTVEYDLFLLDAGPKSRADNRGRLAKMLKAANQYIKPIIADYIWQHDPFRLGLTEDAADASDGITRPCLHGSSNYGDSLADEWLIVYILVELSKQHPDLWMRISDTDGEFLLIEAANALPKWLDPEIAGNRVWISNGHLRIIPLSSASRASLTLDEALQFISHHKQDMMISPFIEDAAFARLKAYPAAIKGNLHSAMISIPRRLAFVLNQKPAYVSQATDAFYLRDTTALKPLATKDTSTLRFPPEDFVTVSVKFNKAGYAQLHGQVFDAPPSWIGIAPRLQDERVQMGMKLTCGFEMALQDPMNKDKQGVREVELLLEDLETGEISLPNNDEIGQWPKQQDDERWLSIEYDDFEAELSGKPVDKAAEGTAQHNLHRMVAQFQDFVKADEEVSDSDTDHESELSSTGEDKDGSFDDAAFEDAMRDMMGLTDADREKRGLLEAARKLAIADGELNEEEEDVETKRMMQLIEEELKDAGSLRRRAQQAPESTSQHKAKMFGPELPPGFRRTSPPAEEESADEDIGPGDEDIEPGDFELSSDDEDFNDVDINLARNLLQSFKGQAGASGPAGNMMRALGMNLPRDEDSD